MNVPDAAFLRFSYKLFNSSDEKFSTCQIYRSVQIKTSLEQAKTAGKFLAT
jgi:hypothetical protein